MNNQESDIHNKIFAERLAGLMQSRGITQIMLAAGIGAGQPTVSRYLAGQLPKANELLQLARFFNVPMEVLVGADAVREKSDKAERQAEKEAARLQANLPKFISPDLATMRETAAKLHKLAATLESMAKGLDAHVDRLIGPAKRKPVPRRKRGS